MGCGYDRRLTNGHTIAARNSHGTACAASYTYVQGNYHFMPSFLTKLSPKRFGEGSTFTAVFRYDRVNLNMDNKGENAGEWEQLSFGLNYRPIEDAVIKMSYQYMPKAFNPVTSQRIHDSAFVMSVATYF
ncbi:MAG: hypothetical protein HP492_03435 [Nitrospira sp.]|nr:hypothetical protein [Nitrospira sp.]